MLFVNYMAGADLACIKYKEFSCSENKKANKPIRTRIKSQQRRFPAEGIRHKHACKRIPSFTGDIQRKIRRHSIPIRMTEINKKPLKMIQRHGSTNPSFSRSPPSLLSFALPFYLILKSSFLCSPG